MTCFEQALDHAAAHDTEADETNACRRSLLFAL